MLKIDKKIPLPKRSKEEYKYPFLKMKIGDSFFLAVGQGEDMGKMLRKVSASAVRFKRLDGGKKHFTVRSIYEGGKGIRCWRVR